MSHEGRWLLALWGGSLGCGGSDSPRPPATAAGESTSESMRANASRPEECALPAGGYAEACNVCLAASCCAPVEACKGEGDCSAQLSCIVACQDDADPETCSLACTQPEGVHAGYVAYEDCSFDECLSTCWM